MQARVFVDRCFKSAGFFLALFVVTAAPAFPLGLEKAGTLTPSGMDAGLLNPAGLWYDSMREKLVAANTYARRIAVLNRQGQTLKVLGKNGELGYPLAVAGNREGTLYIAERGSETLLVLPAYDSGAMEEYGRLDLSPYRRSVPVQPAALFVDPQGDLYVADRGGRQLLVLSGAGELKLTIADLGDPADVWVDASGNILVADPGLGGIRVYAATGGWIRTMAAMPGQLREPLRGKALVSDRRGRIWVVEEGGGRIKALDSLGNLLAEIEAGLISPVDLALDDQDNLYVLEQGRNRIAVFRISGF